MTKPEKTKERLALEAEAMKYPYELLLRIDQLRRAYEAQHGPLSAASPETR